MWGADRVAEAQAIANLPPAWPEPQPFSRLLAVGNYDRATPYHHVAADFEEVAKILTDWWIGGDKAEARLIHRYDYISPEGIAVSYKAGRGGLRQDELNLGGLNKIDGEFDRVSLIRKTHSVSDISYEIEFSGGAGTYGFYCHDKGKYHPAKHLIVGSEDKLSTDFEALWLNNPELVDQMVVALRVAQRVYLQDQLKEVPRPSIAQRLGRLMPDLRQRPA